MRAVIYARYSSDKQTEQSIEGQLSVCQEYAQRNNIEIVGEYIDRAISGRTENRPDFQKMIADSAKKQWDAVIVYKGDRFARDRISSAIAKKSLRDNGVRLISATENIPDTPEGIILESLLEGMAEYYSAELSQKIRRGLDESRKKGQVVGGKRPIGYGVQDKKYFVIEEQAQTVRLVFGWYIDGKSGTEIEEALKAEGRMQPNGKPITRTMIYKMVHSHYYAGTAVYPAIITEETWQAAERIHKMQKERKTRVRKAPNFSLMGKVFCGECGEAFVSDIGHGRGGTYYYYKCSSAKRKKNDCHAVALRKETLETIVFDACCEVMEGDYIAKIVDRAFSIIEAKQEDDDDAKRLTAMLHEREQAINNIISAIEQGIYTPATKTRLETLENEASDLLARIRERKAKKTVTRDELLAFLSNLIENRADDHEFRSAVFSMLVRNVIVFKDKIRITFNYTPDGGKDIDIKDEVKTAIENAERFDFVGFGGLLPTIVEPFSVFFTPFFFGIWVKR